MTMRPTWQNIEVRQWDEIKSQLLASMPMFGSAITRPDPGLDHLPALQQLRDFVNGDEIADLDGLRTNLMAEAVFLYHKCCHTQLAVCRLSELGMNSWAMFNAYHSALLGAKGAMALLGVAFPKINGAQVLIDAFPPAKQRGQKKVLVTTGGFATFKCVRIKGDLQQRYVWEAFQRVIRQTKGAWGGTNTAAQIEKLNWERVTPPRNAFLYKAHYWTEIEDLATDIQMDDWADRMGTELDEDSSGFLFRLSLAVHSVLTWLMKDLAAQSNVIREQMDISRWPQSPGANEWPAYTAYVATTA